MKVCSSDDELPMDSWMLLGDRGEMSIVWEPRKPKKSPKIPRTRTEVDLETKSKQEALAQRRRARERERNTEGGGENVSI